MKEKIKREIFFEIIIFLFLEWMESEEEEKANLALESIQSLSSSIRLDNRGEHQSAILSFKVIYSKILNELSNENVCKYLSLQACEIFNDLRLRNQFCDATIVTDDETEFQAHRVILSGK